MTNIAPFIPKNLVPCLIKYVMTLPLQKRAPMLIVQMAGIWVPWATQILTQVREPPSGAHSLKSDSHSPLVFFNLF